MVELSVIRDLVAIFGVIVGFSYYFLTVRNTNKARKIQLISRTASMMHNMENVKSCLELLDMQWEDYDDFVRKYDSTVNHDNFAKRFLVIGMMSETGLLLHENVIDIETAYKMLDNGFVQIQLWNKLKPIFMKHREIYEDPTRYQWFEYLVTELRKERVRKGLPPDIKNVDGYWTE